jgi:SNF2 family DNA or RNA helicase
MATGIPQPLFNDGDAVVKSSSAELGTIHGTPRRVAGDYWYKVRFVARAENVVESNLRHLPTSPSTIEELAETGAWGRLRTFRSAMSFARLKGENNRNTVYTFRAQRILFEPYQYKPLLYLLGSRDRRLLVADEVGLGKTIEAGLILTELEARGPDELERVLVVCPSRLRTKWREELSRKFEQEFEILSAASLRDYAESLHSHSRSRRRWRAIASINALRSEPMRDILKNDIGELGMLIFDEAHHCRNPATSSAALLRDLCEISQAVVLLSATPIHLGNRDLFTLVNALRPDEFRDAAVFDAQLTKHAPVLELGRLLRAADSSRIGEAQAILTDVFVKDQPEELRNPLAVQVIADLSVQPPQDRREWVDMERRVQQLHPLASIMTRTRKRDVKERAIVREAKVVPCRWSADESRLYDMLVGGAGQGGWFRRPATIGQVQRARQAASCLPAAAAAHAMRTASDDDDATELSDIAPGEIATPGSRGLHDDLDSVAVGRAARNAPDAKYNKLIEVLDTIWQTDPGIKVIIFTYFRGTAAYLHDSLTARGIAAVRIAGDVPSVPHEPNRDERGKRLESFRDDPNVQVLVSTEVGSEGLDFQFASHVINYDLPWNPMVLEQRIGRVDRFGQISDKVYIWNFVVEGSVEERILERLYSRIGIFNASIGDLEEILGKVVSELQSDYLNGRLTPEQAEERFQAAVVAAENRKAQLRILEQQAGELFGHEEYIKEEIQRVGRLGRYVTESSLLALLEIFLEVKHPGARPWQDAANPAIWHVRLTENLRFEIQKQSRLVGQTWWCKSGNDEMRFTFNGDVAFANSDTELLNATHPLIRLATQGLEDQVKTPEARVGQAMLTLEHNEDTELEAGTVFCSVFELSFSGLRPRKTFEVVAWHAEKATLLPAETAERLLYLITERGKEWTAAVNAPSLPKDIYERIGDESMERTARIRANENRENEAMYLRRLQALNAEYDRQHQTRQKRLDTAIAEGKTKMAQLMEKQITKLDLAHSVKKAELERTRMADVAPSAEPIAMCAVRITRKPHHSHSSTGA